MLKHLASLHLLCPYLYIFLRKIYDRFLVTNIETHKAHKLLAMLFQLYILGCTAFYIYLSGTSLNQPSSISPPICSSYILPMPFA